MLGLTIGIRTGLPLPASVKRLCAACRSRIRTESLCTALTGIEHQEIGGGNVLPHIDHVKQT